MPELPEVQTIIDDLNKKVAGDTVTGFWSDHKKALRVPFGKFTQAIKSAKIIRARRIGKNILVDLDNGKTIYIHLKMTGHLLVKNFQFSINNFQGKIPHPSVLRPSAEYLPSGRGGGESEPDYFAEKVNQYIHHIFYLGKNKTLEFSDLRKFGKLNVTDTDKIGELKEIKTLGVDPLKRAFTSDVLHSIVRKRSTPIKLLLMQQEKIAGIGNIYASEILFGAGINPGRQAVDLKPAEISRLYKSIKKILKKATHLRGTSDSDYRDTSGAPGSFGKVLMVYNREKQPCKKCGTIIKRMRQGQRSTYFCPKCQK